jgi:hypothetical protein
MIERKKRKETDRYASIDILFGRIFCLCVPYDVVVMRPL